MQDLAARSDNELLADIDDDDLAFEELHRRYFGQVIRFINCRVRQMEDAQDLTLETFITTYAKRKEILTRHGGFRAYLFGVARVKIRAYYRERELRRVSDDALRSNIEAADVATRMGSDNSGTFAALEECLNRLSQVERDIVLLYKVSGFTLQDISEILGKSIGTVHKRWNTARQKLQNCLMQHGVGR